MAFSLPQPVARGDVNFSTHMLLVSNAEDEQGYVVPLSAKRFSDFLTNLVGDDTDDQYVIPVNDLHPEAVRAVAAYLTHYATAQTAPKAADIPKPCPVSNALIPSAYIDSFENAFCRALLPPLNATDFRFHTTLIHAANFLNIKDLLLLMCCTWAMRLKGKTLDAIKALTEKQTPLKVGEPFTLTMGSAN